MSVRLVDWIEGSYRNTDKPYPRGEVYAGGANIVLGYYNNEQLTSEDFKTYTGIRYFATGDIGEMRNGELRVLFQNIYIYIHSGQSCKFVRY